MTTVGRIDWAPDYGTPERRDDNPLAYQAWLDSIYGAAYEEAYPPYDPDSDDDGEAEDE